MENKHPINCWTILIKKYKIEKLPYHYFSNKLLLLFLVNDMF